MFFCDIYRKTIKMVDTEIISARKKIRKVLESSHDLKIKSATQLLKTFSKNKPEESEISLLNCNSTFNINSLEQDKQQEFSGQFEFFSEINDYTISFSGNFDGSANISQEYIPPLIDFDVEIEIDVTLEYVVIDMEGQIIIDFLSNKNIISKSILRKIEKNISEILKNKLI